ncbi:CopG family transcriptional regulator [Psychroflexus sp. MES1-P1E]|nr:CopG family transcriptional regulator [Psychroflexus sp. MES1-P1E]
MFYNINYKTIFISTFTSSLPDKLLQEQLIASKDYKMLKNMSIEMVLEIYLEQLDRAVYLKFCKRMAIDMDS